MHLLSVKPQAVNPELAMDGLASWMQAGQSGKLNEMGGALGEQLVYPRVSFGGPKTWSKAYAGARAPGGQSTTMKGLSKEGTVWLEEAS